MVVIFLIIIIASLFFVFAILGSVAETAKKIREDTSNNEKEKAHQESKDGNCTSVTALEPKDVSPVAYQRKWSDHPDKKEIDKSIISRTIINGDKEALNKCIINGLNINKEIHYFNESMHPINLASMYMQFDIIDLLVEAGAQVNIKDKNNCYSPLHYLFDRIPEQSLYVDNDSKLKEIISLFISNGADLNAVDSKGLTPIYYLIANRLPCDLANMLINNGASLNLKDNTGDCIIHKFCRKRNHDVVKYLLGLNIDVDALNNLNESPLTIAVSNKDIILTKILIEGGANLYQTEKGVVSPLNIAINNKHFQLILFLLEKGCRIPDDEHKTIEKFQSISTLLLIDAINEKSSLITIEYLINHGSDINKGDSKGRTPIWYAIIGKSLISINKELINLLISHGADVNKTDNLGFTILDRLLDEELQLPIIDLVINLNGRVNEKSIRYSVYKHIIDFLYTHKESTISELELAFGISTVTTLETKLVNKNIWGIKKNWDIVLTNGLEKCKSKVFYVGITYLNWSLIVPILLISEFDFHPLPPNLTIAILNLYVNFIKKTNTSKIKIIHGTGKGIQRDLVEKYLESKKWSYDYLGNHSIQIYLNQSREIISNHLEIEKNDTENDAKASDKLYSISLIKTLIDLQYFDYYSAKETISYTEFAISLGIVITTLNIKSLSIERFELFKKSWDIIWKDSYDDLRSIIYIALQKQGKTIVVPFVDIGIIDLHRIPTNLMYSYLVLYFELLIENSNEKEINIIYGNGKGRKEIVENFIAEGDVVIEYYRNKNYSIKVHVK